MIILGTPYLNRHHSTTSLLATSALHTHAHPCTIPCSHSSLAFLQAPLADRRHHPTAHTPARYAECQSMCIMTTLDACCSASYGFPACLCLLAGRVGICNEVRYRWTCHIFTISMRLDSIAWVLWSNLGAIRHLYPE